MRERWLRLPGQYLPFPFAISSEILKYFLKCLILEFSFWNFCFSYFLPVGELLEYVTLHNHN